MIWLLIIALLGTAMGEYDFLFKEPDIKAIQDVLYAEGAGGNPEEMTAIANVILNRLEAGEGLKGFSSYRKKDPQYIKASTGDLNEYEKEKYDEYGAILKQLMQNPEDRRPWWFMENVEAFGEPSWVTETGAFEDIGRQRFYERKSK